ncbi:MAG: ABC transporter permease [Clostridiales bacterium]|nr:ABC transporter permease [Clostridiales bacterium]
MEQKRLTASERFQIEYIRREQLHKRETAVCRFMLLALILAVWELCARLEIIDDFIFSSPSRVLLCFFHMASDGSIFGHIGITLFETIASFLIVTLAGIAAALALWASRGAAEVLEPYLVLLNSLPKSALAPMLIVWLGTHVRTIVVAAVSVALFGSIMTLYTGFQGMDPDQTRLIRSLGGNKTDVLLRVLLPGSLPLIVSNMKVNVGLCLVGVVIGEFLAADRGLGYLIIYGSQVFKLDMVMMSIVILCLISAALYRLIALAEQRLV